MNSEAKKATNRAYARRRYARLHGRDVAETARETAENLPRKLRLPPRAFAEQRQEAVEAPPEPKERKWRVGFFYDE